MLANDVTPERLRRLADHNGEGKVLSVFVNLDPREYGTGRARASQIRSVIDRAGRVVDQQRDLPHDELMALRGDLERVQQALEGGPDLSGAHGLAVFASGPSQLFELLRLPAPIEHEPVVDETPCVEPVAAVHHQDRWAVVLVNRQVARLLYGTCDALAEVALVESDTHGQHDQGGWSQARYQRGIEKEKDDHLKDTGDALMRHFKRQPFERLIVGGPREVVTDFEQKLHHYLRERLAGRIEVDVEHSNADQVLDSARPLIEKLEHRHETEVLEKLGERGACGLDDVLPPLNERRVELLILDEQFGGVTGVQCLECGWLGLEGDRCPADGSEVAELEDLTEAMIELSVQQSADLLAVRHERSALEAYGGAAALLRF
jgi:hypothetical protein